MVLCDRCSSIPWSFFYNDTNNGNSRERDDKAEHDHQSSYSDLKSGSDAGCQFCDLILFWANDLRQKLDDDACKALESGGRVVFRQGGLMFSPAYDKEPTFGFTVHVGDLEVELDYIRVPESVGTHPLDHKAGDSSLISSWVSECLENHDECSPVTGSPFLPTRVLEITEPNIRLVTRTALEDRIKIEDFKYVALSYCWGNDMPINAKSLKDSVKQHENGIDFETLPMTFQDAIVAARSLQIPFIWIDSLCIIQDSLEDWQNEAAKMADIYSNAVFTLIASSSASVTQGFRVYENLKAREKTLYFYPQTPTHPSRDRIYISPSVSMTGVKADYDQAINTRAWTFQERELSRRKLCFSANGITWECRRHKCKNNVPWGEVEPIMWKSLSVYDTQLDKHKMRRLWGELVAEYSRRSLTKDSDRFPALSGIVKQFQELTSDKYVAGLWSSDAVSGLLWRAAEGEEHRRPTVWVAPTWSWASVTGKVQLHIDYSDKTRRTEPKMLKMKVHLDSPDPFGSIKEATLTVSGKLKPAFTRGGLVEEYYDRGPQGSCGRRRGRRLVELSYGLCIGIIRYDVEDEVQPGIVFCLRIMPLENDEKSPNWIPDLLRETVKELGDVRMDMSVGLAVVPTGRKYGEYRRIGLLENILDAWLDDVSETEVQVV